MRTFFTIFSSLLFCFSVQAEQRLSIATTHAFEPYTIDSGERLRGIDVEIGNELYKRLKLDIDYQVMPWARQLAYAEKGEVSGILTVYCEDERDFLAISKEHFYKVNIALFAHKDRAPARTIKSLKDLPENTSVGIVRDNYFIDQIDPRMKIKKELSHSTSLLIPQLALGRIDFALEEDLPFRYYAKQLGVLDSIKLITTTLTNKVCTAFSKEQLGSNAIKLAAQADKHIIDMRQSGFIQSILNKYTD